ncbi:protein ABHD12B isoform X3 [Marmota monax]|uniref:protein ABHD12B isoform X3 n=1 Tax=Marmota monax TaxID=9995 RepID=UPI0026F0987B|nr:protein ABHD12B isoform X3 [Marmota monax]
MNSQDCEADAAPGPPACDYVATWWNMVLRNLRSLPHSCSTLRGKIAALYISFTSKPLKEHIFPPLMDMLIYFNFYKAPFLVDLKKPESKIPHTVNFYIRAEPRVMLGIWHTVPSCRGEDAKGKDCCWYEAALHDGNPIIVYLHGSAEHRVATNAAKVLEEKGCPVDAIVLEAPFTNIWDASINYPLLKIYQKLPGCVQVLMDALRKDRIVFPSDENVKFLSSPLLILHGEDDRTVPLECGKKLYEIAHDAYRHKERVKMVIFPPGFHHNFLHKSPILLKTVRLICGPGGSPDSSGEMFCCLITCDPASVGYGSPLRSHTLLGITCPTKRSCSLTLSCPEQPHHLSSCRR